MFQTFLCFQACTSKKTCPKMRLLSEKCVCFVNAPCLGELIVCNLLICKFLKMHPHLPKSTSFQRHTGFLIMYSFFKKTLFWISYPFFKKEMPFINTVFSLKTCKNLQFETDMFLRKCFLLKSMGCEYMYIYTCTISITRHIY